MGCCGSSAKQKSKAKCPEPAQSEGEKPVEEMTEEEALKAQRKKAKKMVKVFVKGMVRGRKLEVVLKTGKRKACACSMSRGLDSLKIKLAGHAKSIGLADVEEIHVGSGLKRVDTPLDELCVTLILSSQDAVTFRFEDVEERDTFAACLLMFVQKAQGGEEEDEGILPTESEVAGFAGSEVAEEEQEEEDSSPTHMSSV
ncbi:unnamed protein product [Symbiodinium sp. KB8]|nr:unnamed protein product [Symbiodinium sp. KB8]